MGNRVFGTNRSFAELASLSFLLYVSDWQTALCQALFLVAAEIREIMISGIRSANGEEAASQM